MRVISDDVQHAMDQLHEALETHGAACKYGTPAESERTSVEVEDARQRLRAVAALSGKPVTEYQEESDGE